MQADTPNAAAPVHDTRVPEAGHMPLASPIELRGTSLAVIALLASVYALHWASAVVVPVLIGLMCSYALSPAVNRLQRWHIPRALSGAVLMFALLGGLGSVVYSLGDDAAAMIESLPDAAQKLRESLQTTRGTPEGPIEKVQQAAAKLELAAEESAAVATPTSQGVTRVQVERPHFNIKDYLWSGTLGLVGFVGQAMVVFFLTLFLVVSGDSFRRKMVKITGPSLSRKKVTLQMLDEIDAQIQRYLMVQIFTSALVGVATWAVLLWFGLERAALWGVVAALLNFVPYLGSIVTAGGLALVGFLQFGTLGMALSIGGASLVINTIEGNLLTPWLTGRASRINPVVIFVGVLAFGWLWGVWGLLLGAPLLMAIKSVCDHVDSLKPIGELLGA